MNENIANIVYNGASESKDSGVLFNNLIWRIGDVAKFLGVSIGHIYNLTSRREIPYRKKGKLLFFIPSEIRNWVEEGEIQ